MTQRGLAMVRISSLDVADDRVLAARTVSDVMKRDVGTVSPEMSVNRAGRVLLDQETLALPVVDRVGHVIGSSAKRIWWCGWGRVVAARGGTSSPPVISSPGNSGGRSEPRWRT